jgi:beta-phosphoglucomutase-like phosphatase (HAD superfamily)
MLPRSLSRVPLAQRPVAIWIETAFLVLLVPAFGLWLNPSDPLFARSAFPWAILAPLIAGVRYGFAPGFAAAAALGLATVAAWKGTIPLRFPAGDLSAERTVGLLLCGMLTGEFSGLWRRRLEALETLHAHQKLRFEGLVRTHQALRVAQDLLESRLGGDTPTLREALRALADLAVADDARQEPLAAKLLDLFATFAQVRQGAVFLASEPDAPLPAKATAALGPAPDLGDAIVEEALRRREVVAFDSAVAATKAGSRAGAVVLAAPLQDVEGRLWGVLTVSDLPYSAYGAESRARIATLAGHVADLLAFGAPRRLAEPQHEESVEGFTRRLQRAAHDRRAHGIASGVVQFSLEGNRAAALAAAIVKQRRITDTVLASRRRDGGETVTLLLPMTDDLGIARYLGRVEAVVRETTGVALREAGVRIVEHTGIESERIASLDLGDGTPGPLGDDDPQPHKLARN